MKKLLSLLILCLFALVITACGSSAPAQQSTQPPPQAVANIKDKRVLVAYFSYSGTTRKAADTIHQKVGGDIFEIQTVTPYPEEYRACTEVAKKERDENQRPAIQTPLPDIANYDVIFIGYPIWWHTAPMAVYTFMESYDLTGKIIIPFCTSGGSDISESMPAIQQLGEKGTVLPGLTANSASRIDPWLNSLGF